MSDTLQTNLAGAIHLARAASRKMLTRRARDAPSAGESGTAPAAVAAAAVPSVPSGGCVVFIGSVVGQHGSVGQSVYAASKAGLHGQTTTSWEGERNLMAPRM